MKIMIVEDNDRMRAVLKDVVADMSSDIREATNGEDAVEQYAAWDPDLVLMDIRMPRMNGIEATGRIMRDNPNAKVVIVTGHDEQSYRDEAHRAGATEFFLKDNLTELRGWLRRRSDRQATVAG